MNPYQELMQKLLILLSLPYYIILEIILEYYWCIFDFKIEQIHHNNYYFLATLCFKTKTELIFVTLSQNLWKI